MRRLVKWRAHTNEPLVAARKVEMWWTTGSKSKIRLTKDLGKARRHSGLFGLAAGTQARARRIVIRMQPKEQMRLPSLVQPGSRSGARLAMPRGEVHTCWQEALPAAAQVNRKAICRTRRSWAKKPIGKSQTIVSTKSSLSTMTQQIFIHENAWSNDFWRHYFYL